MSESEVLKERGFEETEGRVEKKGFISWKEAFSKWFGLFLVLMAVILISLIIYNFQTIVKNFFSLFGLIKPIVYGCVIAYILNPLVKWIQGKFLKLMERKGKVVSEKGKGAALGISIVLSLIFMILVVVVLCWMVVPQLVSTISSLVNVLPEKAQYYYQDLEKRITENTFLADNLQKAILKATGSLEEIIEEKVLPWMQSDFLPGVNTVAVQFVNGVSSFINVLYNFFIGLIVAIYILLGKSTFSAQAKKITYGIFSKRHADILIHYVKLTHKMFSGFIFGKIVDSAIMGVLCLIMMTIFRLPYAMLISVIVGVTNIIPFFGPYIGLIPSVFLIVLVSPMQALYFIIMIAILQQVDGNLIGPAILGESTGLSAFWVLFSILFFGGLWGLPGMIVGVPFFAVIYRIVADILNWRLRNKSLSTVTDSYRNLKEIRVDEKEGIVYVLYQPEDFEKKDKETKKKPLEQLKKRFAKLAERKKQGKSK
ncbi:MAG: AI-2E family transporter [Lachnospiraceae bacterium]|nr:AI-2E family transporter [Lachnospiraceae bacterium]